MECTLLWSTEFIEHSTARDKGTCLSRFLPLSNGIVSSEMGGSQSKPDTDEKVFQSETPISVRCTNTFSTNLLKCSASSRKML